MHVNAHARTLARAHWHSQDVRARAHAHSPAGWRSSPGRAFLPTHARMHMHGPRAPRARRRWLCWQCSSWLLRARAHPCTGLHARACRRIRVCLRMRTCGHTPTPAGEAPGPRAPRPRRCCPTRDPLAPPTLAMVRTCTGFPAAERRQQHARRQGKARRLTQVPWAESRRPLAQPAALSPRMGPERPILAMTVKVFLEEEFIRIQWIL